MAAILLGRLGGTRESMRDTAADALGSWVGSVCGSDDDLARTVSSCAARFLARNPCTLHLDPAPGWRALARLDRAAVALRDTGTVRSTEFLHVPDVAAFSGDPAEREWVLGAAKWDDKAAVFTPVLPPRRTRDEPTLLDWGGEACTRSVPDQVRRFEYLLNADLQRHAGAARILEGQVPGSPAGHRRLLPSVRNALVAALSAERAASAAATLEAFRALLDPERLATLSAAAANSVRFHNWLCGQDRSRRDDWLARTRTQAAAAFPVAWPFIADPVGPVRAAVEARQPTPLSPLLSRVLGVPEAVVRRMNGLTASAGDIASPDEAAARAIALKVARMPPGASPSTERGWRAFFRAVDLADTVSRVTGEAVPPGELLATAAGRWNPLDAGRLSQAARGFADMVADLHANLLHPAAVALGLRGWDAEASALALCQRQPLDRLAEASAAWHERQATIHATMSASFPFKNGAAGGRAWPPLHVGGPWITPNGLEVHALASKDALLDEHARMGHCINTYVGHCLFGGAHIVSVRRPGVREPLGTAELRQADVVRLAKTADAPPDAPLLSLPPGVVQFQARMNERPVLEAWEGLWAYVGAILTGGLEIDTKALVDALGRRLAARGNGRMVDACYNASAEGALRKAWELYAPVLPRSLAKRGPRGLVQVAAPEASPSPGRTPG